MSDSKSSTPLTRSQAIELYFMEHRAKVIDIAAFLDRVERGRDDQEGEDFRMAAFEAALKVVLDGKPRRAQRVLELLSDPTSEAIPKAHMKGALGAYPQSGRRA